MSTSAQIIANQANAQHSTGPRSPEGKSNASQNNFRHGFTGSFKVLDSESQEAFVTLLEQFATEHQPASPYEFTLVEKMAQHFWLAQRALRLQEQCFSSKLAAPEADKKLALYLRYQTTHDRAFRQTVDDLRKSRNEKRKQEIGFESQERQAAAELRKQEMHEARVRLIHSQSSHREIDNEIRRTVEGPLPGRFKLTLDDVKRELQKTELAA